MFAIHDENGVNNNFVWIPIVRFVLLTHFFTLGILLIIKQKTWLYRINFVCIVKAGSVWFLSILQFFYGTSEFCFRSQHDTWTPWETRAVSRKAPLGVKGLKPLCSSWHSPPLRHAGSCMGLSTPWKSACCITTRTVSSTDGNQGKWIYLWVNF